MSTHMITDEEYQKIANWLFTEGFNDRRFSFAIRKNLNIQSKRYDQSFERELMLSLQLFIRQAYDLNRLALVTRYGDSYDRNDDKKFVPSYSLSTDYLSAISILMSLKYQCAEYVTCETKTFENIKNLINDICYVIVRGQIDDHEARKWEAKRKGEAVS